MNDAYYTAIGIDVSDRKSQVCVMTKAGGSPRVVLEATIPTTKEGLSKFLATPMQWPHPEPKRLECPVRG